MNDTPPTLSPAPPPKKRNWLLIGCLGALALFLLLIGLVVGGGWYFYRSTLDRYTAARPLALAATELSTADQSLLQNKLDDIYTGFQQGRPVELDLSAAELNAALGQNTDLRDRVRIEIKDGKLHGQVSVPLDDTGWKALKGRWLNGDATLTLTSANGQVRLTIDTLTVNGQPLPAQLLDGLRTENLVETAAQDREVAQYLERIESVAIEGDRLRVRFKPGN